MSDYTILDTDAKIAIVRARITQNETEHYQHSLNLKIAEAWPDDAPSKPGQIAQSKQMIAQLDAALDILDADLKTLQEAKKTESAQE